MEKDEKIPKVEVGNGTTRRGFLKGAVAATGGAVAIATVAAAVPRTAKAQAAPSPMSRFLFVERQNCTGCRACEYACSTFHHGVARPALSRVHVYKHKSIVDVPVICWHCDDAPCIESCPVSPKAIEKHPDHNGIILNERTCLGERCLECVDACPALYLRINPDTGQPIFCNMCEGDPQCVKACLAQSGNPQGPCLLGNRLGFGVNQAFRDVTPVEAGDDLVRLLYYPNTDGGRR